MPRPLLVCAMQKSVLITCEQVKNMQTMLDKNRMEQACLVPSDGWENPRKEGRDRRERRGDAMQHGATRAMKTKAKTFHLHSTSSLRLALNNDVHQQKRNENWKILSLCGEAKEMAGKRKCSTLREKERKEGYRKLEVKCLLQ